MNETPVERAKYAAIVDRKNIQALTIPTGGWGQGLEETVAKYDRPIQGASTRSPLRATAGSRNRTIPRSRPSLSKRRTGAGARGLKILKTLGLYLRENITSGSLVKIDDPRFDPMWDACGQLNLPVAIHVSDPLGFFTLTDRFNERYEE